MIKRATGTVVDSGARAHLSSVREDFSEVFTEKTVRIDGAGGRLVACWGTLKASRLHADGEQKGVFCASLPVKRLYS